MVHVSTLYGLGQSQDAIWEDSHERLTKCLLSLIIAQIFGVSTMGMAKVSLGLLLLRLVTKPWHRWAIWAAIAVLFVDTAICAFAFAFQCAPPAFLWDKTIPDASCPLPITPFAVALGAGCVAADLFFAVFPWFFVWQLNRPFQERLIIAVAMSLGLAAAACGVKRTIGLGGLQSANYTIDAVPTCAWSIAELAITLVCIAIPVCLPLFKHIRGRATLSGAGSAVESGREKAGAGAGVLVLRTFGGSSMPGSNRSESWARNSQNRDVRSELSLGICLRGEGSRNVVKGVDAITTDQSRQQDRHGSSMDIERQMPARSVGADRFHAY